MKNTKTMYQMQSNGTVHQLYLYDDIAARGRFDWSTWEYLESETSAKYIRDQLEAVKDTDSIELYINSNGGEVKEGVAIYNMLKRHKAEKTAYVDGNAYSVASLICMAADKIIMGLGTSMLIHNMWMIVAGNADELRKAADDLDALMTTNRQVYLERSNGKIKEEELTSLMKEERFLTPDECMAYGFCDEISKKESKDNKNPTPETHNPEENPSEIMTKIFNQMIAERTSERKQLMQELDEIQKITPVQRNQLPESNRYAKATAFFNAYSKTI